MKFVVQQSVLRRAITLASKVVPTKTVMPALSNVLLTVTENQLTISATDLSVAITQSVACQTTATGSLCVSAKMLSDVISTMPNDEIHVSADSSNVKFSCGKFVAELAMLDSSDYPTLPNVSEHYSVGTFNPQSFRNAVSRVVVCAANDNSRPVLTGMLMKINAQSSDDLFPHQQVSLCAADGFRLAIASVSMNRAQPSENKDISIIIPANGLGELTKVLAHATDDVEIGLSPNANLVSFSVKTTDGTSSMVMRLIEGKYPDVERVIPTDMPSRAVINKSELMNAIKMSKLFVSANTNILRIDVSNMFMQLQANADGKGKNSCMVDVEMVGEPVTAAFNVQYFEDAVSSIETDTVVLLLRSTQSPAIFQFADETSYKHIVMPMMVK